MVLKRKKVHPPCQIIISDSLRWVLEYSHIWTDDSNRKGSTKDDLRSGLSDAKSMDWRPEASRDAGSILSWRRACHGEVPGPRQKHELGLFSRNRQSPCRLPHRQCHQHLHYLPTHTVYPTCVTGGTCLGLSPSQAAMATLRKNGKDVAGSQQTHRQHEGAWPSRDWHRRRIPSTLRSPQEDERYPALSSSTHSLFLLSAVPYPSRLFLSPPHIKKKKKKRVKTDLL